MTGQLRLDDLARDRAAARLVDCYVVGMLTEPEMNQRIRAALGSRTRDDLEPLFADLPGGVPWAAPGQLRPMVPAELWTAPPEGPYVEANEGRGKGSNIVVAIATIIVCTIMLFGVIMFFQMGLAMHSEGGSTGDYMVLVVPVFLGMIVMTFFGIAVWLLVSSVRDKRARKRKKPMLVTPAQRTEVMHALSVGRDFLALDTYRRYAGVDIPAAKTTIDAWKRELPEA